MEELISFSMYTSFAITTKFSLYLLLIIEALQFLSLRGSS
jgi:hypothetical protein